MGIVLLKSTGSKIRPIVMKEIEKFGACGDPRNGFKLLVCEGCHHVRLIPSGAREDSAQLFSVEKPRDGVV